MTYLSILKNITQRAAKYGIYTLLDMHQDVLSEMFCGEGIPKWAVKDMPYWKWFKGFPQPLEKTPYNRTDAVGFPIRADCAKHGWTDYHIAEQTGRAFEALWKNVDGIRDNWANMWKQVVTEFMG